MADPPEQPNQKLTRPIGGYTDAARFITLHRQRDVSRQQVWMWWSRRERNKFPSGWDQPTKAGGAVRRFYLDEVLSWHLNQYRDRPVSDA